MTTKTLNVRVSPPLIRQLNEQGFKLCFATGVQSSGRVNYNVIASTYNVAPNISIQWEDSYAIAGTMVTAATSMVDINLGQTYTLPQDFTNGTVNNDPSAPQDGFRFFNEAGSAAAIIYKRINGQNAPIYISAMAPLPPGTEDITPLSRVAVWFQRDVETSVMVSELHGASREMEMSWMTEANLEYTGSGVWVQS
ncbi:hypothetical protein N0V84_006278 [Fusarium piperis]|uniref:Uncharacterized protein n=1 Tax=Fusarium piperis TaxID=1435070 RepID=A0A9W8WC36_9HYPO|nr:hypothetical protein N0V84_006278 [Fusarium piperis]